MKGVLFIVHIILMFFFLYLKRKGHQDHYDHVFFFNMLFGATYIVSSFFQLFCDLVLNALSLILNVGINVGCLVWYLLMLGPDSEAWSSYVRNNDEYLLLMVLSPLLHIILSVRVYNIQGRIINKAYSDEIQSELTVDTPGKRIWFVNMGLSVIFFVLCFVVSESIIGLKYDASVVYFCRVIAFCLSICISIMQLSQNKCMGVVTVIVASISYIPSIFFFLLSQPFSFIFYMLYWLLSLAHYTVMFNP